MKIIVSGVPCCGKTYFGDWLRDVHGFTHVNLEDPSQHTSHVIGPSLAHGFPNWLSSTAKKIIVTWGFPPNQTCYRIVRAFSDCGFSPWWFEADLQLARNRYVARDGEAKARALFDPQAQKLASEKSRLEPLYGSRRVTTLLEGGYLTPDSILSLITLE